MKAVILVLLSGSILGAQASRSTTQPDPLAALRADVERLSKPESEPKMPAFEPGSTREERTRAREAHFKAFAEWSQREEERKIRLEEVKNQIRSDPRSPEYQRLKAEREKLEEALAREKRDVETARQAKDEAEKRRREAAQKARQEVEASAFADSLDVGVRRRVNAGSPVYAFDFFGCRQFDQLIEAGDTEGAIKYAQSHGSRCDAGMELIIIESPKYHTISKARVTNTTEKNDVFWFRRVDLRGRTTRIESK